MPVRSRKDLATTLKQGKIEPVYLLYGPETKLRDDAARAIADEALREHSADDGEKGKQAGEPGQKLGPIRAHFSVPFRTSTQPRSLNTAQIAME